MREPQWGPALDATPVMISIHDADYRITKANAAVAKLLRKKPGEIVGRTCYEVVHGSPHPPADCPHTRVLEEGTHQTQEILEPRLGMKVLVSCSPLFGADGTVVGSIHIAMKASALLDGKVTKDLSERQKQILKLFCSGKRTKEIAAQLAISPRTVDYNKRRMMNTFAVRTLPALIAHVHAYDTDLSE